MANNNSNQNIHVFDDVLVTLDDQRQVSKVLSTPRWSFNGGGSYSRFWHLNGLEDDLFCQAMLHTSIATLLYEKAYRIQKVKRIYANGQTAGQSGVIHRDDSRAGAWTFVYFSTPFWKAEYAGNLHFYNPDNTDGYELRRTVQYQFNRGVLFPSALYHNAEAPSRHYDGLRTSIAFKLDLHAPKGTSTGES